MRARKMRRLIDTAWRVPYYRNLFQSNGIKPGDIRNVRDLSLVPVTRKEDIQGLPAEEVTVEGVDPDECGHRSTSGATGEPLEIITRPSDLAMTNASFLRAYMEWGMKPWHRMASFQVRRAWLAKKKSWYQHLRIFPCQMLYSGKPAGEIIEDLSSWRPYLLCGYPMTLELAAQSFRRAGARLKIPLVASCSGVLPAAGRSLLEEVFEARVVDIYASEEAGSVIAWECPDCGKYHVAKDNVIVEVLTGGMPTAPGEKGEVVVTSLNNHTMPFIRYAQSDVAVPLESRCHREPAAALLDRIWGREWDFIILPSGKKLTPHLFYKPFYYTVGVGQWRLVQKTVDTIDVQIVETQGLETELLEQIEREVRGITENEIDVRVRVVPEIDWTDFSKSYKRRAVMCLCS